MPINTAMRNTAAAQSTYSVFCLPHDQNEVIASYVNIVETISPIVVSRWVGSRLTSTASFSAGSAMLPEQRAAEYAGNGRFVAICDLMQIRNCDEPSGYENHVSMTIYQGMDVIWDQLCDDFQEADSVVRHILHRLANGHGIDVALQS